MSATTAGAIKAHMESAGLGIAFYRDRMPPDAAIPCGVILEAVVIVPVKHGDFGDLSADRWVVETAQVSLYQAWRGADGHPGETYPLADQIHRRLHGSRLEGYAVGNAPSKRIHGVTVVGYRRMVDVDQKGNMASTPLGAGVEEGEGANVIAHHYTIEVRRDA